MHKLLARTAPDRAALKELQRIPGIGPRLARDLADLGIRQVGDLRHRNPERLYDQLRALRGRHEDRCVLYAFRCAVYFATTQNPEPEKLKWWNWLETSPVEQPGLRRQCP